MLKKLLIESCHLTACSTVNEYAIEDVHTDDFLAQVIDVAWSRLGQLLAIIAEVDSVAAEYRIVAARYTHNIQFETATLLQFLILRVNLRDEIASNGSHTADKQ